MTLLIQNCANKSHELLLAIHDTETLLLFIVKYCIFTARHFITRALLTAENFEQAQKIIRDKGCGAGNGCSFNMTFLNQEGDRLFHNAEMAPAYVDNESGLNILTVSPGEHTVHCNR